MTNIIKIPANSQAYLAAVRDAATDKFDVLDLTLDYINAGPAAAWQMRTPEGLTLVGYSHNSAMDSSGLKAIYCTERLYTTVDAGLNWVERRPMGDSDCLWTVAMSSDGNVMLAVSSMGRIWKSTNDGDTWSELRPLGNVDGGWQSVATNSDGSKILVCRGDNPQQILYSANGGSTWSVITHPIDSFPTWTSSAMSADGQVLLVCTYFGASINGKIWLSTDAGANWVEQQPAGAVRRYWDTVAMGPDGQVLLAGAYSGRLWLSTNGGSSWTEVQLYGNADRNWESVAVSKDGSVLFVLCGSGGRLWRSDDLGASWVEQKEIYYWAMDITTNLDGTKALASGYSGDPDWNEVLWFYA